jgi:hypothetical protein
MAPPERPGASSDMRRSYIRVLIVWAVTLAALYVFPKLFA